MKVVLSSVFFVMLFSPAVFSQSCQNFNDKGMKANSLTELLNQPASKAQVDDFKKVIGEHAGDIAGSWNSSKKNALNLVRKNKKLTIFIRESLAMTRGDCFAEPSNPMESTAIKNFDFLLNAVIKKHNL